MKLYFKECRRSFHTKILIFFCWLCKEWTVKWQTEEDEYFGMKTSEDNPEEIMTGVTRNLLREYKDNVYATYPLTYAESHFHQPPLN